MNVLTARAAVSAAALTTTVSAVVVLFLWLSSSFVAADIDTDGGKTSRGHIARNTVSATRGSLETFDACVDDGTHVAAVEAATATAWSALSGSGAAGIAVPLFLVNDGFWRIGIPTMEEVRTAIALHQPAPADDE